MRGTPGDGGTVGDGGKYIRPAWAMRQPPSSGSAGGAVGARPASPLPNPPWHAVANSATIEGRTVIAQGCSCGETVMFSRRTGLAVAALVLAAWLAGSARAADDAALQKRALALNEVTGD